MIDVAYANITFVETQFRAGPRAVPGHAADDPGQRRRRHRSTARRVIAVARAARAATRSGSRCGEPPLFDVPDGLRARRRGRAAGRRAHRDDARSTRPRSPPGERVLVEAAAGGVGTLLVQLAAAAGATVVAAAGSAQARRSPRSLGADEVVDYTATTVGGRPVRRRLRRGRRRRRAGRRSSCSRRGGRMLSLRARERLVGGRSRAEEAAARGVTLVQPDRSPEALRAAPSGVAGPRALRPLIGQRFPLERAADAHAAIESRATARQDPARGRADSYRGGGDARPHLPTALYRMQIALADVHPGPVSCLTSSTHVAHARSPSSTADRRR